MKLLLHTVILVILLPWCALAQSVPDASNVNVTVSGTTQTLAAWLAAIGGEPTGTFSSNVVTPVISPATSSSPLVIKNSPAGSVMMVIGGTTNDINPGTDIVLPGGTWGSGALTNGVAPIFQNNTFAGTTTGAAAAFGMFLQQTDNSSNASAGFGIFENLVINGTSAAGGRVAGIVQLSINNFSTVTQGPQFVGFIDKCNLAATIGTTNNYAVCFGENSVAHVTAGVSSNGIVGNETDTWSETGANILSRIGIQIVDVSGASYGQQATIDDVAFSMNNQYGPSSSLGYKIGIEFGRYGGNFPVATNGTMVYGTGNVGGPFTVANGIDWHLGTATNNWLQFGNVFTLDYAGNFVFNGKLNGWSPQYTVRDDSTPTPANAGSGYAVGDTITLNDNCSTPEVLVVDTLSGSGVSTWTPTVSAVCNIVPTNPVGQSSTSGAGTGATFTLAYAPIAARVAQVNQGANGNLFSGIKTLGPAFSGLEATVYSAGRANYAWTTGNFINIFGLNAGGGACPTSISSSSNISAFSTDALRDFCGGNGFDAFGAGAFKNYGVGGSVGGQGASAFGNGAGQFWNSTYAGGPTNMALFGPAACKGAGSDGSPGFTGHNVACIGGTNGAALTSGNNIFIAGAGIDNTGTSGSALIMIGSGAVSVEPTTATTSNMINIENIFKVTGTGTPSTSVSVIAGTLNVVTGYQANGTAGQSCAANTVVLSTFTVTNGIVTHC